MNKWFTENYHRLSYGGIWARGEEINTLPLSEMANRPMSLLIVRPSSYADVANSFTHQYLYQLAASNNNIFPDLAYLPSAVERKIFEKENISWVFGTKSKKAMSEFFAVAFSLSIVQEIINLPQMLRHSGIPLDKQERMKRDDLPLIILGGASALWTPILWGENSLVDLVFVGDDPATIEKLFAGLAQGKMERKSKDTILEQLACLPGVILPDVLRPVRYALAKSALQYERGPVLYNQESMGEGHLKISSGCRGFCSFCAESWEKRPYKDYECSSLLASAKRAKANMGLERIDLFSFSFNMYKELQPLLFGLLALFKAIGLKSERFDYLALDLGLWDTQKLLGKSIISCGLEGISPRLRRFLNKNLTEELLRKGIELVLRDGQRELKIFLLATGREEEADYVEFEEFVELVRKKREQYGDKTRVIFSITPLVRFPFTPLAFDHIPQINTLEKSIQRVEKIVVQSGLEFRLSMSLAEWSVSQTLVRANWKHQDKLLAFLKASEFVYDNEISTIISKKFIDFMGQDFSEGVEIPVDLGLKNNFLKETFLKNSNYVEIGSLALNIEKKDNVRNEAIRNLLRQKRETQMVVDFYVKIGPSCLGLPKKYAGQALARAIMLSFPELVESYYFFSGSSVEATKGKNYWVCGDDILSLAFEREGAGKLRELLAHPDNVEKINGHFLPHGELISSFNNSLALKSVKYLFDSPFVINDDWPYLKERGLRFTLSKKEGITYLELAKDSLKKKYLSRVVITGKKVEVSALEKFEPEEFAQGSFKYTVRGEWVRTLISRTLT
ncbi:MAG: hypothetical protein A2504_11270 [Bdellovibrionales bacterium RIFOXYD12_FULL_39_22]|nr:MAG: hypothetical protein A2385_09835 [Bdellovibrionales bacterium RIFOXYB1_FULL_39_21]OFZ44252.1 MAG: hypothetical protein A2485_07455 [Bdellovibrionales bacterium RIFOXYC12_FULL_39_17]OFZ46794.1 MAG: hypothetical protein A2404_04690 [Bdellovibrionales bacterium RIFOXYC1_FULL_39_130]OFZ69882.1 MAG: hypothetical protein A2451_01230 [Bdellovibrionales bacterium RIFOXYC2_FULL_39_8]OFZ75929.1 MAG: hypothetical protein A2560_02460 [Bdellovibrionales bacterium RIFOXYD1_FULL_39_84]OFZ95473.1 MAG: